METPPFDAMEPESSPELLRKKLSDAHEQDRALWEEHLSDVTDLETAVLRGHLLVELKLGALIHACTKTPQDPVVDLLISELGFKEKVDVVRSVWKRTSRLPEPVWKALLQLIEALNELRNAIAHSLRGAKWEEKLGKARKELSKFRIERDRGVAFEEPCDEIDLVEAITLECTEYLTTCAAFHSLPSQAVPPERSN